jgi:hypothetical protein
MAYTIGGRQVSISEEPRIVNDRLFVPLAALVEQLGGRVSWDNSAKVATATIGQWVATIRMDNPSIDVSGTAVTLASAPFVENDRMYVPATFFHDAYGYTVNADHRSGQVSISLPGQSA